MSMSKEKIKEIREAYKFAQKKAKAVNKEWVTMRSALGVTWAVFIIEVGGREAGKSYAVMDFFLREWKNKNKPFTWLRLTDVSVKKMLQNKADKLIDADLRRKYDLDISVVGMQVYDHKKPMCKVLALSTFYNDKGVALYDNTYDLGYNIALDEMNREVSERKTFDINYAFVNQMENLVRSTKEKMHIFLIGNTLEEASDLLAGSFEFLPETFGRYYLHKKRAVIDYLPPSEKYLARRSGTIADILSPNSSTFTNQIEVDKSLIIKSRLRSPTKIIAFSKDKKDWFTLWDGHVVKGYNGEKVRVVPMRPYLDAIFNPEERDEIMINFDQRAYNFRTLFEQKNFKRQMELLKPRKG